MVLFDIDGTLVDCAGAGRRSMNAAFEVEVSARGALDGISFGGMTDRAIVRQGLERAAVAITEAMIEAVLARYVEHLASALETTTSFRVLPGAREAVLRARGDHTAVGLGTGNVRAGATMKLARGKLDDLFTFGGFGCDAELRAEVLRRGVERGAESLGVDASSCEVLVVGDTPRDIDAARAIGASSLAVVTGAASRQDLEAAGPTILAPTLEHPEALAALGR